MALKRPRDERSGQSFRIVEDEAEGTALIYESTNNGLTEHEVCNAYDKAQAERIVAALSDIGASKEEAILLHAVLNKARETLLVSINGTPDELQRSLGALNFHCKAHWDWETEKRAKEPA